MGMDMDNLCMRRGTVATRLLNWLIATILDWYLQLTFPT